MVQLPNILDLLTIPDPDAFRQVSTHFQNWGSQHQEYMQQLDNGHSNLTASWQGDGANAYSQMHTQMRQVSDAHQDQRQQASSTHDGTATLLEAAQALQDLALGLLAGAGIEFVMGFFTAGLTDVLAAPETAEAVATEGSAQGSAQGARLLFQNGFQALEDDLPSSNLDLGDFNFDGDSIDANNGEPSDPTQQFSRVDSPDDGGSGLDNTDGSDDPRLEDLKTRLDGIQGTNLDEWSQMTPEERLNALQEINNEIADVYGFPPNQIISVDLPEDDMGAFDPATGNIDINSSDLGDDGDLNENYQDGLETLAHESRHAYQQYLVDVFEQDPTSLSDADRALARQWSDNMDNYISPDDDFEAYLNQPIEADAESWATDIFMGLLGDL